MTSTHLISRLQYRVSCPDEAQAFELRHMLSSIVTQEITAAMDEICSRHVAGDEWIRIPKLEIDLGNISMHTLRSYLTTLFSQQFEQQLQERINSLQPEDRAASRQTNEAEMFFFFLENGFLPRWASAAGLDLMLLAENVLAGSPDSLESFLNIHREDGNIWLRMAQQFDMAAKEAIISGMPGLRTAYAVLQQAYKDQLPISLVPAALQDAVVQRSALQPFAMPGSVTHTSAVRAKVMQDVVLRYAPHFLTGNPVTEKMVTETISLSAPDSSMAQPGKPAPLEASTIYGSAQQEIIAELIAATGKTAQPSSASFNEQSDMRNDPGIADAQLVIHTSGIVLLHPFLKPFFSQLKLWQGSEWTDEAAQQKAIHILHYLSTGKQQQPEWNLVLEKIICGLAPQVPIQRNIILEEAEMAECDALLTSVIEHWAALKSTSVAALQEVFLRRDGLLQQAGSGWVLQVAHKTHDVLLEALPWNLSILKFPWTDYLIEVLWQ